MLILDADGLIKLHRASILEEVAQRFQCIIPNAVYDEVVTKGKEHGYVDAEDIDRIIASEIAVQQVPPGEELEQLGLGNGETEALALATQLGSEAIVVTDDRQFLGMLIGLRIPFLVPAAILTTMAQEGFINRLEASEALERMRPIIPRTQYQLALQDLEALGAQP